MPSSVPPSRLTRVTALLPQLRVGEEYRLQPALRPGHYAGALAEERPRPQALPQVNLLVGRAVEGHHQHDGVVVVSAEQKRPLQQQKLGVEFHLPQRRHRRQAPQWGHSP